MIRGRVIGSVWGTRRSPALAGHKLALVAELDESGETGRVVVCFDRLDAETGREVVVSFGSGARNALTRSSVGPAARRGVLVDAAVTQIVEGRS